MNRWTLVAVALVLLMSARKAVFPTAAVAQDNPTPSATADRVETAASSLAVVQVCAGGGRVNVTFQWQGNDPYALQQWVDLSIYDPNFGSGSFISAGPLPGFATSYTWP